MKNEILRPSKRVYIISSAAVGGEKEKRGPIGKLFDLCGDDKFGKDTFEKSEAEMQKIAVRLALDKARLGANEIDCVFAGDLVNQCIPSAFGIGDFGIPFFGLYGACSTCAEGMIMAAVYSGSVADRCVSVTSSHYCTAERQFRYPLEYGGQRSPTSQWTVTASGAFVYSSLSDDVKRVHSDYVPEVVEVMPGRIIDRGISDSSNMGAAMAPSAADTLERFFSAGHSPDEFDLILTGDLGSEGSAILCDLLKVKEYDISRVHGDCGLMIYPEKGEDVHAGGSGCGCSASVMAADIIGKIGRGEAKNILFLATGALMNPLSVNQGLTIPGIAHLVHLKAVKKDEIN